MQHLSGTVLERAAHLQHLTASVDAGQQATFSQPVAKRLFAQGEPFRPCDLLDCLVAQRWI